MYTTFFLYILFGLLSRSGIIEGDFISKKWFVVAAVEKH